MDNQFFLARIETAIAAALAELGCTDPGILVEIKDTELNSPLVPIIGKFALVSVAAIIRQEEFEGAQKHQ